MTDDSAWSSGEDLLALPVLDLNATDWMRTVVAVAKESHALRDATYRIDRPVETVWVVQDSMVLRVYDTGDSLLLIADVYQIESRREHALALGLCLTANEHQPHVVWRIMGDHLQQCLTVPADPLCPEHLLQAADTMARVYAGTSASMVAWLRSREHA